MTHHSNDTSSQASHNNSMSKLILADTGNTNKALQPGTPFLLQGCMCQEGDGVIVVKVNWRDKTYTGSLMDMEQYPWATPKHVEIADLGSPLDKELRFSPRFKLNQTKQTPGTSQDIEEQQPKEDDIVMSPQSSEMVESDEGKSPDIPRQILPKLTNCTELNKTNITSFMDVDDKRGLFAPRSKQTTLGLLSSPSTSLTDLKAESEKKKNHDLLTGLTHPKEVVIPSILGNNVLPFDTTCREKANINVEIKEEVKEDPPSRPMIHPTKLTKPNELTKREGFVPTIPIMPQYPMYSSVPPALLNMQLIDQKQKIAKPIADKHSITPEQLHQFQQDFMHKQEPVSPKSSNSGSPSESKGQKKRKNETNDYSIPKRPDTLIINCSTDHFPSFITPEARSHVPVNKTSSLPSQTSTSPSSHTPRPHSERKVYNTTPEYILSGKEAFSGMKLHRDNNVKDRHDKYAPPQPLPHTAPQNRGERMRLEKKPKRQREGESPSEHNVDMVSKANHHAFIPTPGDTKVQNLIAPNIKVEAQSYIPPEMFPLLPYSFLVPGGAFAEQQKLMQAQANIQEVKIENDKKSKTNSNSKSKSQPKPQLPISYDYFQPPGVGHPLQINPQVLTQNHLALLALNQNIPMGMIPKDGGGIALPTLPVMLEQEKDKIRSQIYPQTSIHQLKQKAQTPQSAARKMAEKSMNHDTAHDEQTLQMQEYMKQYNAQQHLLKHQESLNSNNIDHQNPLNIGISYKHKSTPTSNTNNKITTAQPSLAMLNPNQQMKTHNGIYPSILPFVMAPDLQQMGLFGNFPFQSQMDPTLSLPIPLFDPSLAMRLPQAQVQPDTLDSK